MSDEEFKEELEDLTAMIENLRLIADRSRRKWLKAEIRLQLRRLTQD